MKASGIILFTIAFVVLMTGCGKKVPPIVISGYTTRDTQGNIPAGGSIDTTDWGYDDKLPDQVVDYMNSYDLHIDHSESHSGTCANIMAFANPCTNGFYLNYSTTCANTYTIAYVVVTKDLFPCQGTSYLSTSSNTTVFVDMSAPSLGRDLYRVYYRFYDRQGTVFYQGHGDISKQ
ncbi:MAG: hypothetical protein JWO03_3576 [Bacteroidetes bacterium]|nr:hypothetical protein [Bacteroidota bacterium]